MNIEYQGKKWDKEVARLQKFKKSVNGRFNNNELYTINEFLKTGSADFLRLYNGLSGVYERVIHCRGNFFMDTKVLDE